MTDKPSELTDHFEKIKCENCDGSGNDPLDVAKVCGQCFGDGWVYKNDGKPPSVEGKPASKPPTAKRPSDRVGAAIYCRNHVKKHYEVQGKELNAKLKDIFEGKEPEDYINTFGIEKTYVCLDIYDAEHLDASGKLISAESVPSDRLTEERTNPAANRSNGQSEPKADRSSDMPQSSKSEPQSGSNPAITDLAEKKDEIRSRYTLDMRGKDYLTVQGRVLLFRLEHSDWTIETDVIAITENSAVFKATIRNPEGRIIATGHGRATESGTKNLGGRFCEKGETAALGRALALAGYGNDESLDDHEYISDTPAERKIA